MKTKVLSYILLAIILLSNTPPAQYFLLRNYNYQTEDRSFNFTENAGSPLDYRVCEQRWEEYRQKDPNNKNKILYRTFTIKPWQFWEWWQYLVHPKRFTLPYLQS